MNTRTHTTIWALLTTALLSYTLLAAPSAPAKQALDWMDIAYFASTPPKTIGVVIVTYNEFAERDGRMVHLDPKLGAKTAHESPEVWFTYKPDCDNSKDTQQVREEIVSFTKTSLTKAGFKPQVLTMDKPDTVRSYLAQLPKCDCYLVICIADISARLMTLSAGGEQSALSHASTDSVLLSSDMKPVAGRSLALLMPLETIGKLQKDYDAANPFREKVSFRFTTKALVASIAPAVRDNAIKPFEEALGAMNSTKK